MGKRITSIFIITFINNSVFLIYAFMDVTTIYRGENNYIFNYTIAECHARTNALGLPFVASNGSIFEPEIGVVVPGCQIGFKPNCPWVSQSWEITGDANLDLPPLKLPRETIRIHTDGIFTSPAIPLFSPQFNFSVKTSLRGVATILLLNSMNVNNAEMYVIDIAQNTLDSSRNGVLKCSTGLLYKNEIDFGQGVGRKNCQIFSNIHIQWLREKHIMFMMSTLNGNLQLSHNESSEPIFTLLDTSPLSVNFVVFSTSNIERDWVLYLDVRVWSLVGMTGVLKSPILTLNKSRKICVSFFSYTDTVPGSRIRVFALLNDGQLLHIDQISHERKKEQQWTLHRLAHNFLVEDSRNLDVQILIEGLKGNPFAVVALHGLMGCNPDDNEEIALTRVSLDRGEPYICDVPTPIGRQGEGVSKSCSVCLHGGKCETTTGECTCPPGFTGPTCEEGCGYNKFGRDCKGVCSGQKNGCVGLMLCVPILGCNCATGFTGSICEIECSPGSYGPNCQFSCGKCHNGTHCDIFTGICAAGCQQGYFPPLCNFTYSYISQSPIISDIGARRIAFRFLVGAKNIAGFGEPRYYQAQIKKKSSSKWILKTPHLIDIKGGKWIQGVVDSLQPGTDYQIRVVLIDKDGNFFSDNSVIPITVVRTKCQVPANPVYHIEAVWQTTEKFKVKWQYKPNDYAACKLIHYRVYLREGWRQFLYNITTNTSITVSNRSPFFHYSVQIQAVTSHGRSVMSESTDVQTIPAAPTHVIHLATRRMSPNELEVHWDKPRSTFGEVTHYIVNYKCLRYLACKATIKCSNSSGSLKTKVTNVILKGLHSHAQYEIKVAGFTIETGPWMSIKAATSYKAPEIAPAPAKSSILYKSITAIEVTWMPVADCRLLNGFPLHYHYRLFANELSSNRTLIAEGNVTRPPINFTSLLPYTDYFLQVEQVVTGGLRNPAYKLEIVMQTQAMTPPEIREFKVIETTKNSVTLKWKLPYNFPDNAVKYFVVHFKCQRLLSCNDDLQNCWSNGTVETDKHSLTIFDLKPFATYDFTIAAFTGSIGNFSSLTARTLTALPETAPRRNPDRPSLSGTTWIAVWWFPPEECFLIHGPLVGYRYRLTKNNETITIGVLKSENVNTTYTNKPFLNFTNLPVSTSFNIEIAVINNENDTGDDILWNQMPTLIFKVETKAEAPGMVKDLVAYKQGNNIIGLRWRTGEYIHGTVDYVNIRVEAENTEPLLQRVKMNPCSAWKLHMCHEIKGLLPNTLYTLSVSQFSSVTGESSEISSIRVKTVEKAPEPPSFLQVILRTENNCIIEWGYPNKTNGILRSFRIQTDHLDSYNPDLCCDDSMTVEIPIFQENATFAAQIKGLQPASEYLITMTSVTLEPSDPISLTVYTKPGVPHLLEIPPTIIEESISNTTVDVVLTPVSNFKDGMIEVYFIMLCENTQHSNGVLNNSILLDIKAITHKEGNFAMTLTDNELTEPSIATIGSGEESFGPYGLIKNEPLRPNTTYTITYIAVSTFKNLHNFGFAESQPFTTKVY